MAKAGFCSQCNANVYVREDGTCANGHPAECVTGVYETDPAPPPVPAEQAPAPIAPQPTPVPTPAAAPAAYAQPPEVPPATPAPVPPGTPPPAKKSKTLMITLIIVGVVLLCCVVAGIGVFFVSNSALNSAKTGSEKLACFANQRMVEGAATMLTAGGQSSPMPTDYSSLIAKLSSAGLISTDVKCPSGGTYTWTVNAEGTGGTVDCSIHGHYSTQPLPSP